MRSLVILLDAANSTDIECSEKLHTTECERSYSKRKSLYLFQLDSNQQCHPLHLGSTQYKHSPPPKKKKKKKEKERKEVEKRRRRKKGWKEFVRKKRKKGE